MQEDSPTRVWDLPTRIFHWVLAATVVGSLVTGTIGGNALVWHMRCGYLVFSLLLFRLVWGFVGGRWSRFSSFVYAPGSVVRYLRGQSRPDEHVDVGHNPLGAFSVFALIGLLALQVGTGLVADDEISTTGPLNRFVSNATATAATAWHKNWGRWILVALITLHLAAIAFYRLRHGKNLVRPMISGDKTLPAGTPAAVDTPASRLVALLLGALAAALVASVVSFGG